MQGRAASISQMQDWLKVPEVAARMFLRLCGELEVPEPIETDSLNFSLNAEGTRPRRLQE